MIIIVTGMYFLYNSNRHKTKNEIGIFSWKSNIIQQCDLNVLNWLTELGITQVYQEFSDKVDKEEIDDFLELALKEKLDIYYLSGDPYWGIEKEAESCLKEVERACQIQTESVYGRALRGIVMDIEPYLLVDFESNTDIYMNQYVENMRTAYEAAKEKGLEFILCIPYYYDKEEFGNSLELLIRDCCDRVAVMNYYREGESRHIENEAKYAEKYKKGLITIYELKKPGEYGLTEINTYHNEGLEAVYTSFKSIQAYFNTNNISMAFHDLEALKEVEKKIFESH